MTFISVLREGTQGLGEVLVVFCQGKQIAWGRGLLGRLGDEETYALANNLRQFIKRMYITKNAKMYIIKIILKVSLNLLYSLYITLYFIN